MIAQYIRPEDLTKDGSFRFERTFPLKHQTGAISLKGRVVIKANFTVRNKRLVAGSYSRIVEEAA